VAGSFDFVKSQSAKGHSTRLDPLTALPAYQLTPDPPIFRHSGVLH